MRSKTPESALGFVALVPRAFPRHNFIMSRPVILFALTILLAILTSSARATVLYQEAGKTLVHENGLGVDILNGTFRRSETASDTLYFKFHIDPLSDVGTEEYLAGLEFFEGEAERFGVGNSLKAYGYSAFNTAEQGTNNKIFGDVDLHSASPEAFETGKVVAYELPRRGQERTIVFKVQYVPGGTDNVTVWMNPSLATGATEENQPEKLTTHFKANGKFTAIHLRHSGNGGGWYFSDVVVATSFNDLIVPHFWQRWWFFVLAVSALVTWVGLTVRFVEKRKFQSQLYRAEQERALEQERARIAQDLHDDLGSSLTRISLLSGLLRAEKDNPAQVEFHAQKLSESANQTVRALEEIVWAVRPGSDTLQSLVDYIAHFANELFEEHPTRCRLDCPHDLPARALPPDLRHNIFLIIKEALTNVARHAEAKVVHVQIKMEQQRLQIVIIDDGKGFDSSAMKNNGQHNGLENMRRRAEAVGGQLEIHSDLGQGTRKVFHLNFPH